MGKPKREDAYAALWKLLLTVPAPAGLKWGERQRGVKQWDQVPASNQPAMFLQQSPERASGRRERQLLTWEWPSIVLVYFRCDGLLSSVDDWRIANEFMDSLDRILQGPIMGEHQTLGGVVYDCYVEGECGLFEALADINQAVLIVPVVMLTGG